MHLRLQDDDGLDTRLALALRIIALLIAIISVPLLLIASPIALLSPMLCDAGCSQLKGFGAMLLMLSPLAWLIAIVAGGSTFANFSPRMFLLTLIAGASPVILYLLVAS